MAIDISKYVAHGQPGKFEGETAATEYFYEQICDGDGEQIYAWPQGSEDWQDGDADLEPVATAELFRIDCAEAEAFGLEAGHWFLLREDSQGFALGSVHATREAAEAKFRAWCGV